MFRNSLRFRLAVILIGITAGIVLAGTVIYSASLSSYYSATKTEALIDVYDDMNESFQGNVQFGDVYFDSKNLEKLRDEGYNKGIQILVVDTSYNVKFANVSSDDNNSQINLVNRIRELIFGVYSQENIRKVLKTGDNFQINICRDTELNSEHIEMWGVLDCGFPFIMRIPAESINDMADIANHYYIQIAFFMALFGVVMMTFVASRITKPIRELAKLSKKMSNLEFDAKYTGDAKDEVGVLGESMNELSITLEKTISELKTANNELQKDIERKTEIDELRKEFVSNVSHELKTPIAIIQGYAEGLKESVNDDEESRNFYCDVIVDEAAKMNRMVRKLMTLNQIEFGNIQVEYERFDIVQIIDNILNQTQILISDKGAIVDFDNTRAVYVWADEFQIEEVLTNYISNAINHLDGDRIIRINVTDRNGLVRVTVANTGANIPEESLSRIWEKFYKVDKSRSREYGGSGIGLSIVKAVMDSIHMKCGAQNVPNGVEFWFEVESAKDSNKYS